MLKKVQANQGTVKHNKEITKQENKNNTKLPRQQPQLHNTGTGTSNYPNIDVLQIKNKIEGHIRGPNQIIKHKYEATSK